MLLLVTRRKRGHEMNINVFILFAGLNFAEWLQNAILLGITKLDVVPRYNTVMCEFFEPENVRVIVFIFLPMIILFRFHSAIVSVELVHEA